MYSESIPADVVNADSNKNYILIYHIYSYKSRHDNFVYANVEQPTSQVTAEDLHEKNVPESVNLVNGRTYV